MRKKFFFKKNTFPKVLVEIDQSKNSQMNTEPYKSLNSQTNPFIQRKYFEHLFRFFKSKPCLQGPFLNFQKKFTNHQILLNIEINKTWFVKLIIAISERALLNRWNLKINLKKFLTLTSLKINIMLLSLFYYSIRVSSSFKEIWSSFFWKHYVWRKKGKIFFKEKKWELAKKVWLNISKRFSFVWKIVHSNILEPL